MKDIAECLQVSQPAVSQWFSGKCRPRPTRLGFMARILDLDEEDLEKLTDLTGYDVCQHERALAAYCEWPEAFAKWRIAQSARNRFTMWALGQFCQNRELQQALAYEHPNLYLEIQKVLGPSDLPT